MLRKRGPPKPSAIKVGFYFKNQKTKREGTEEWLGIMRTRRLENLIQSLILVFMFHSLLLEDWLFCPQIVISHLQTSMSFQLVPTQLIDPVSYWFNFIIPWGIFDWANRFFSSYYCYLEFYFQFFFIEREGTVRWWRITDTLTSLQGPPSGQAGRTELSFPGYKNGKGCLLDPIRHLTPENPAEAKVGQFRVQILDDVVRV